MHTVVRAKQEAERSSPRSRSSCAEHLKTPPGVATKVHIVAETFQPGAGPPHVSMDKNSVHLMISKHSS